MVRKQAIGNLILNYVGYGLGSINYILLMPLFFSTTEIGLMRLLNTYAVVFGSFVTMGASVALVKYFPMYKTEDGKHRGFVQYSYLFLIVGFILFLLIFLIFQDYWMEIYAQKSSLFNEYYIHLIVLIFFTALFIMLESQSSVIYQTLLPSFLKEVLLRVLFTIGIVLYSWNFINLNGFVNVFTISNVLICMILIVQLYGRANFSWRVTRTDLSIAEWKEIGKYASFATFSNLVIQLMVNIDIMILSTMVGLSMVGVYGTYASIAMLIAVPTRSMLKITLPIISTAWHEKDYAKIQSIYAKSAILQTIASAWIYLMVLINSDNLLQVLNKPEFSEYFSIYIFLGLSYFINALFGINHYLIGTSPLYRYDFFFNIFMFIISSASCYVGVYFLGGLGAAVATCATTIIINIAKWYFIKIKFKMDIFSWAYLKVIIIMVLLMATNEIIPFIENIYIDLIIRSGFFSIIFILANYWLNVSADFNNSLVLIIQKLQSYLRLHRG